VPYFWPLPYDRKAHNNPLLWYEKLDWAAPNCWLGSISHRVQFKNTQLFRGALSPNDALQKIIRVRNTHATVHLGDISTNGNFKKSKTKQYIEDLLLNCWSCQK